MNNWEINQLEKNTRNRLLQKIFRNWTKRKIDLVNSMPCWDNYPNFFLLSYFIFLLTKQNVEFFRATLFMFASLGMNIFVLRAASGSSSPVWGLTYWKNGYLLVGGIYTSNAVSLKPHSKKSQTFGVVFHASAHEIPGRIVWL